MQNGCRLNHSASAGGAFHSSSKLSEVDCSLQRVINDPPKVSEISTQVLEELSHVHPQAFYKPLFACATGTSIVSVANHLSKLIAIGRYMPYLWTSDAEMVSVAIVGDPGGGFAKGKGREGGQPSWGTARLGQSMLILELIDSIKSVRAQYKELQIVSECPS